ncbi:hypothetical protein IEQ34_011220 [Dendrobium chrysotoxum]|uniref:Uncharacterized protein n=1 Tax=Dendrobium chrysotoxum TaxID=161865 RepID=A0AAV7GVQ2_DENCH|nr:hypothetical protein IEQ34_011220 [Dendrobium chrysotoxum]
MVICVKCDKGYIDLNKLRVLEEDIHACEECYNKSKLVHSIVHHISKIIGVDIEYLYIHIDWRLYCKFSHTFEAFKLIILDPESVLELLVKEVKEIGSDGPKLMKVVPAMTEELKDAPDAMRKAEAVGNDDCLTKTKLVTPLLYVLTTKTLDNDKRRSGLNNIIKYFTKAIENEKGKLIVKEAPTAVSECTDKLLAKHMEKLKSTNEEVDGDADIKEEEDIGISEVDVKNFGIPNQA